MPSYLVETFLPRAEADGRTAAEERARRAAAELTRPGRAVHFDHSIHIPSDETCFFVFLAPTASDVAQAATGAGLSVIRIVEAATSESKTR